jgi:hypothetical protein
MLLKTANKALPLPAKDTDNYRQYRNVHRFAPHLPRGYRFPPLW